MGRKDRIRLNSRDLDQGSQVAGPVMHRNCRIRHWVVVDRRVALRHLAAAAEGQAKVSQAKAV